jgi:hypothetical protein
MDGDSQRRFAQRIICAGAGTEFFSLYNFLIFREAIYSGQTTPTAPEVAEI